MPASPNLTIDDGTTHHTRSRRIGATLFAATIGLLALLLTSTSAGAELGDEPTNEWGVEGLLTGSGADTILSEVWAIETIGNRVYVGGRFTEVTNGGQTIAQPGVAAFDSSNGDHVASWNANLDGTVFALEASPDGSRLFVGGSFETVDGVQTGGLVALDPATGDLDTTWAGRIGGYNLVRAIDVDDTHVYVAGGFGSIQSGNQSKVAYRVGRFDLNTGVHDENWRPVIQGGSVWGIAVSPDYDRVYLAGSFNSSNQAFAQQGFAAISTIDATNVAGLDPVAFNTTNPSRRYLYDVVVANGLVWVGGSEHFVQALNESDMSLNTFHLSDPKGDFQDLEVVGNRVYAGCHCRTDATLTSAYGVLWFNNQGPDAPVIHSAPNTWVVAFDATTAAHIPTFTPSFSSDRAGIWAIADGGQGCVWFGGNISSAAGQSMFNTLRLCEGGVNPADQERPSTPGKPVVDALAANQVTLSWNASTDNVGVTEYRIYDNLTGTVFATSTTNSVVASGIPAGTYQLYTRAYDAAGNESWRSGYTDVTITDGAVDTERPSPPTGLMIDESGSDAVLTWNASTDNVGVIGYRVFDSTTNTVVADVSGTTHTITGLAPGSYSYYVKAYDAAGNQSWRSNIEVATIA